MATAESNRAIPVYRTGPVDQLGRGQQQRVEVLSPSALPRAHPLSGGVCHLTDSLSTGRKTENSNLRAARPPPAFQTGTTTWRFHLPWAESGRLERRGITRASVSSGARRPGRFTLHGRSCHLENGVLTIQRQTCSAPRYRQWYEVVVSGGRNDKEEIDLTRGVDTLCPRSI